MSNELPENFSLTLQRHGETWHVVKFHQHQYPSGNPTGQPLWDVTFKELERLGYEIIDEVPFLPGGERRIQMSLKRETSVFERVFGSSQPPALAQEITSEETFSEKLERWDAEKRAREVKQAAEEKQAQEQAEIHAAAASELDKKFGRL